MTRNLKAIGLALVAVLAMGAVAASGAQAAVHFTSSLNGTDTGSTLSGTQTTTNVFETSATNKVSCKIAKFSGVAAGTATEQTIEPTYEQCTGFGLPATVTMNKCDYLFTTPTKMALDEYTGKVDLVCPANTVVEVHLYLFEEPWAGTACTITVGKAAGGSQEFGTVTYTLKTNTPTSANTIVIDSSVTGIPVEEHGSGCPDGNTKPTTGNYTGSVTVSAASGGTPVDIELTGE